MQREQAEIGVLLSFEKPTAPMRSEAASSGFYTSPWGKHPRVQLVAVEELLSGQRIDYPPANVTFRQAEPLGPAEAESMPLPFAERVDD